MVIYGIIGYMLFRNDYDPTHGAYSGSFDNTILSTITRGIRSGGGIGDSLKPINPDENNHYT